MPAAPKFGFIPFARPRGVLVVFCEENLKFGRGDPAYPGADGDLLRRAAAADRFTGKNGSSLDIVAPAGLDVPRLVVVGTGKDSELKSRDIVKLGGIAMGKVPATAAERDDFCRIRLRRAQGRAGRRSGARRAAARLHVRPLQDQAQRRRRAAEPRSK